jgi:hypothetical protein
MTALEIRAIMKLATSTAAARMTMSWKFMLTVACPSAGKRVG